VNVSGRGRFPLGLTALAVYVMGLLTLGIGVAVASAPDSPSTTPAAHQHVIGPATEVPIADAATRAKLSEQLGEARKAVAGIHTAADAMAQGYKPATIALAFLGTHYLKPEFLDKPFSPSRPTHLIFDSDKPDARLVGLMYYVDAKGGAPDGFAGPNDLWHTHAAACMSNGFMLALDDISSGQCTKLGGAMTPLGPKFANRWMLHVWAVPGEKNPWGMFADGDPVLA
jgi:hypothetical protein